ncbi:MAG: hypothetical protein JXQ88_00115 [Shimia sp.]
MQATVPCPNCKTAIPVDMMGLSQGTSFECGSCQSVISLTAPNRQASLNAMDALKTLASEMTVKKDADE